MKNIMKEAHSLTKKIIRKGDSYRATFRLALIFVHSQIKKVVNKMVEYKTSKGASVRVELEGKNISYLSVNSKEIISKINEYCFISSLDNYIHISRTIAKEKLGLDGEVKIESCEELMSKFREAEKKAVEENMKSKMKYYNAKGNSCKVLGDFQRTVNDINYVG